MSAGSPLTGGEVRLAPESVEAIARRLAELLHEPAGAQAPQRLVSAADVAETWGVNRSWVYTHAEQLGARRLGAGERPRLRFDPEEVAERIGALTGREGGDSGRSPGIAGGGKNRSKSSPNGAIVGRQTTTAGRRSTRPRPGAEGSSSAR